MKCLPILQFCSGVKSCGTGRVMQIRSHFIMQDRRCLLLEYLGGDSHPPLFRLDSQWETLHAWRNFCRRLEHPGLHVHVAELGVADGDGVIAVLRLPHRYSCRYASIPDPGISSTLSKHPVPEAHRLPLSRFSHLPTELSSPWYSLQVLDFVS